MRYIYFPFILLLNLCSLRGQNPCTSLNYHSFRCESVAGTYEDIGTSGSYIDVSDLDDGISAPQEIGFTFEFNCQSFTQFIFNTNGFIKLGAETTPKTNLFFNYSQGVEDGIFSNADSNNVNLLVAFNHDIEEGVGTPDFRVHTTGDAPYRVCTIQWENMREWTYEPEKQYDNMDFQIRLYETTNIIEFVYGIWDPSTNISNYKTAACGLKGSGPDDDQLLVVIKSSSAEWGQVTFQNGNYAPNQSFNFGNPPDRPVPDVGRTYRFTPTFDIDLNLKEAYVLGQASRYYSSPQPVSATVQNTGFTTLTAIPVILDVSNANTYRDTQYISQLAFGETAQVSFPGYAPQNNGTSDIRIHVPDDDFVVDNGVFIQQIISDTIVGYYTDAADDDGFGFLSGAQGICYTKYPLHGTAQVQSIQAYIANDTNAVGKVVFVNVLNGLGQEVARSTDYILQENDLNQWLNINLITPPTLSDDHFYAGFGMRVSPTEYNALGVQLESPVRRGAYYTSFITGTGLKEVDTLTFGYRFMIGATLKGTTLEGGTASGNVVVCYGDSTTLSLNNHSGFIQWQNSSNGISGWAYVTEGIGEQSSNYTTPPLFMSTYFRAEVIQPGNGIAYSNILFVDVIPSVPVITSIGDVLMSSAAEGNQWYDANGLIAGATDQLYLATSPGVYYVIVTQSECVSPPSNSIELLSVSTKDIGSFSPWIVSPNPFTHQFILQSNEVMTNIQYKLTDIRGHALLEGKLNADSIIPVQALSSGVYVLTLTDGKSIWVEKVIKSE